MNIKKIYPLALVASVALSLGACASVDGDEVNRGAGLPNAVYFEGVDNALMSKLLVTEEGASGEVVLRSASLVSEPTKVNITIDESAIVRYNEKFGTGYKLLPAEYYELSASEATLTPSNISAQPITVKVKPSVQELDQNVKYAIPLKLEAGTGLQPLASAGTKLLGLDRPITTSAIRQEMGSYAFVQFEEPFHVKEWTLSYGLKVDSHFANQQPLSPDFYSRITPEGRLQVKAAGSDDPMAFSKTILKTHTWYHVTLVYKDKHIKMYLDGVLDTEFDVPTVETFTKFNLGWGNYAGYFRDIRLYKKALTPFLIQENLYVEDPTNPDLLVYYPLTKETIHRNVKEDKNHMHLYKQGTNPREPFGGSLRFEDQITFPQ